MKVKRGNIDLGTSRTEPTAPMRTIGQAKYAVRGLGPSIYQDKTRYTADDYKACEVSDKGKAAPSDESQGGKY